MCKDTSDKRVIKNIQTIVKCQQQENKQDDLKMGKRAKHTLLTKEYIQMAGKYVKTYATS